MFVMFVLEFWKGLKDLMMKNSRYIVVSLWLVCSVGFAPSLSPAQPLAKGQGKFLGCSMSTISSNFGNYFNQVTPENAGKWGSVEGSSHGVYSWSALDNIYSYALSNYFPFKDHNLVWGQQQPSWIAGLDSASQRAAVEKWIDTVGQRYPSMSMIDVVNEPLHAVPSYANALGGSGATGWDWVVQAFKWAREYCFPGVKLLINEYSVLGSNSATTNYINIIDTLKVRGLIDGIGIQGHYFEFKGATYSWPIAALQSNLNRIAATGLPIYISEFDIDEADDSTQLANYKIYFPLLWENPAVKGITLWGYMQGTTWKQNAYLVRLDGSERPALQWLRIYVATPAVVSPVGLTDQPRDVTLVWRRSAPATSYKVQIATDSLFSSIVADTIVIDTLVHLYPLAANTSFFWHVSAVDSMGASANSVAAKFTTGNHVLAVEKDERMPTEFKLSQNYPNPFNPVTQISYTVPRTEYVSLKVYNLLGQEVATLVEGVKTPGVYRVTFDGSDLTSGVYLYTEKATNFVATRKLVLLK
jgi:endo-1,4-beta-xylanase